MAKRTPLVSQHLENVSRDALVTYQQLIRQYIRGRQGIYALFRKNRLSYVGLTSNPKDGALRVLCSRRSPARVRHE
jgi:hypothetical protein